MKCEYYVQTHRLCICLCQKNGDWEDFFQQAHVGWVSGDVDEFFLLEIVFYKLFLFCGALAKYGFWGSMVPNVIKYKMVMIAQISDSINGDWGD